MVENNFHLDQVHMTGNIRGFTHAICNENFRIPKHIRIVKQNLSNYGITYYSRIS